MKKYMEILVQFKFVWGLFYAAAIIIYTVINMLLGHDSMRFVVVWQFMIITIILTAIQYMVFGGFMLSSLSTPLRLSIHFILCYITILVSAIALEWIDPGKLYNLAAFTGAYTFMYGSFNLSMYIYYKTTGEKLNSKLAVYKQKKNIN